MKETFSPGYFLFAREGCYLEGRPRKLNGDILCRFVGINDNGNEGERIFSDVFGTGNCRSNTCNPTPTALGNLPSWCADASYASITKFSHYGVCLKEVGKDDDPSKGPWVGYVWTRGDIFIGSENVITAPRAVDPLEVPPALNFFPVGSGHPEWPTLYSEDDIGIGDSNLIYGKIQTSIAPNTFGTPDIYVGAENEIYGRVVAEGDITFRRRNVIFWDGQGTSTTAVSDAVFYQDLGW